MSFHKLFNPAHPTLPILLYVALGLGCLTSHLSDNGDNVSYIYLSQNLLNGQGYINTFYPGEPVETQYPPLLPVLLIPILAFWGQNYLLLKCITLAFGALGLFMGYRLFCHYTTPSQAWVSTLLTAVNASYLMYATDVLTEMLYVFLSTCTLISVHRLYLKETNRDLVLSAFLLALTFYARTVGVSLIVAVCGVFFLKRRFKLALKLGALAGLMILPWFLRSLSIENSYYYQLTQQNAVESPPKTFLYLERMAHNLPRYAGKVFIDLIGGSHIANLPPSQPIKILGSALLFFFFCLGWIKSMWQKFTFLEAYLFTYLGIFAIWPYHDARFLVPILPFIFLYIQKGVIALPFLNTSGSKTRAPNISAAILFLGCLLASLVLIYNNQTQFYTPETQHFRQACFWLKNNSPPDALVLSRNPRMAANWAHRKTWWYTTGNVLPQATDRGIPISPTHILVSHYDIAGITLADEFEKLRAKTPEKFKLVYKTAPPQVSVYAIQSQGP